MPIKLLYAPKDITLKTNEEEVVKKGLRLLMLVGNEEETLIAARILNVLAK